MYTLGAITLFIFIMRFVVFRMQESPKYLVYRGQDEKAISSLDYVAKFNGQTNSLTLKMLKDLEKPASRSTSEDAAPGAHASKSVVQQFKGEMTRYRLLFVNRDIATLTILVWLTYAFDFFGFTTAGEFPPRLDISCGVALTFSRRNLPTPNPGAEERRIGSVHPIHLPKLHLHLHSGPRWRRTRRLLLRCAARRPQMDDGHLLRLDGRFHLPLQRREQRSVQHRVERDGVFLPEHVQRRAVRVDARGVSSAYSRYGVRDRELLGEAVGDRGAVDSATSLWKLRKCE